MKVSKLALGAVSIAGVLAFGLGGMSAAGATDPPVQYTVYYSGPDHTTIVGSRVGEPCPSSVGVTSKWYTVRTITCP